MGARPAGARDPRRVRRVAVDAFHVVLLLVAMPLGAGAAAVALLATVAVTASRTLGAIAGVVALILCTGGLSLRAVRGVFRGRPGRWMRRWVPVAVTGLALLLTATVVGVVVFAPGPRATPLAQTADTRYWDLATGSRIAYTFMPAARDVPRPTPVLLVHGGPGAPGRAQQRVMATLADAGFDVYDYHQVGAGLSGRLEDVRSYTVARHVADLEAIRTEIGADSMALVGGSWGGQLIANYMVAHPERVARAVVSSPGRIWAPAFEDGGLTAAGAARRRGTGAGPVRRMRLPHLGRRPRVP